jgi:hypothetical protein
LWPALQKLCCKSVPQTDARVTVFARPRLDFSQIGPGFAVLSRKCWCFSYLNTQRCGSMRM